MVDGSMAANELDLFVAAEEKSEVKASNTNALRRSDEADLEWYWCFGESLFHRSTFGSQLERAELMSYITERCLVCDGEGIVPTGACKGCRGMGFCSSRLKGNPSKHAEQTKSCPGCDTRGKRRRLTGPCDICGGAGYVEADFAVVGSHGGEGEPSYTPDDGALRRYAVTSRRLSLTERRSSRAPVLLEAMHGLQGLRWARTDFGRLYAVVPFTEAGGAILRRDPNPAELTPHSLFENIVAAQAGKKDPGKGKQIAKGLEEAAELYSGACSAYNAAVYG
jgi:hypothetical protein